MTLLRYILILILVFLSFDAVSQSKKILRQRVSENKELFLENPDKAYSGLKALLKEAEHLQDSISILNILDRKCRYFYTKEDLDNLITASENLKNKAVLFKDYNAQAMSHVYLAEAYSVNQLFDKAVLELDQALILIRKTKLSRFKDLLTKNNILISQANLLNEKGNPREAARRLLIAISDYEKIQDPERIRAFQYVNFSNIASIYAQFDVDSAEIYVRKSIQLEPAHKKENSILSRNYYILGKIYFERKDNNTALKYFLKASDLKNQNREVLDLKDLYSSISLIYKDLEKKDSSAYFQNKLREIELQSLENRYKSLHKVINKETGSVPQEKSSLPILLYLGAAVTIAVVLVWYFAKAKRNIPETNLVETYNSLIQLAGKNDPAYLPAFEKIFPDFSENLLEINPDLSMSEIEFCSLLKLNLSTKKIAQLKFIEPRTVQNKKHRIRKRLDIPTSMDIYNWFNKL